MYQPDDYADVDDDVKRRRRRRRGRRRRQASEAAAADRWRTEAGNPRRLPQRGKRNGAGGGEADGDSRRITPRAYGRVTLLAPLSFRGLINESTLRNVLSRDSPEGTPPWGMLLLLPLAALAEHWGGVGG